MYLSAPTSTRNQLAALARPTRGRLSGAVEVGTHRGDFARVLMEHWPGVLYCVDPWSVPVGYEQQASYLKGGSGDRQADYAAARAALAPWGDRVLLMQMLSHEAAPQFRDGDLDLVYIDGDHSLEAVRLDLELWWPKLRAGGILAGHDWLCPGEENGGWGRFIQPAVHDFAEREGVDVYLIVEEGGHPFSFYMVKP